MSCSTRLIITFTGCVIYILLYCAADHFGDRNGTYLLIASFILMFYSAFAAAKSWSRVMLLASLIFNCGLLTLGMWPVLLENALIGIGFSLLAVHLVAERVQAAFSLSLLLFLAWWIVSDEMLQRRFCWPIIAMNSVSFAFALGIAWWNSREHQDE